MEAENQLRIEELGPSQDIPLDLLRLADPSEEAIRDYLDRGICYVATIHNRVVGEYVLLKTRPFTSEIVNIAVDAGHQGSGIGKQLVLHAIDTARKLGAKTLEIGTGNSSIMQLALYQKCGFTIRGIDYGFFRRHYQEAIFENGIACIDMIRLGMDL